ncbi:MAG: methyltransferase domain-containing protein [Phycisphaerales bacterium]|nr:methyltransferase domain-containing protein [Phycisphaerales bacterium]
MASENPHNQAEGGAKAALKRLAFRAMRPGLSEVVARLDRIEALARQRTPAEPAGPGAPVGPTTWRGDLATGRAVDSRGLIDRAATRKYRQELSYWVQVVKRTHEVPNFPGEFEATYGGWQRGRIEELRQFLGLGGQEELNAWCAERTVVEIGPGPYPSIATRVWKRAVAVDPLADGYVREDLLPKRCHCDRVTFLAAPGEMVPLPTAYADLVVIENALDHVDEPGKVVAEVARLLRPGGLLWLLVDLMDYSDEMHPNPFNEETIRGLLGEHGFEVARDRVSEHKSHPQAYGEYRGLLRSTARVPGAIEAKPATSAAHA